MERAFEEKEVFEVVTSFNNDKAPTGSLWHSFKLVGMFLEVDFMFSMTFMPKVSLKKVSMPPSSLSFREN